MRRLNPDKLLYSKWTAMQPRQDEKPFIVVHVGGKKTHRHRPVTVQAVLTGHITTLDGHDLTDEKHWRQGWH